MGKWTILNINEELLNLKFSATTELRAEYKPTGLLMHPRTITRWSLIYVWKNRASVKITDAFLKFTFLLQEIL